MVIIINNVECELNFGIGFVRELDKRYFVQNQAGARFGTGLDTRVPMLLTGDAVTLAEFIYLGTGRMEKQRPSMQEVDDYVDGTDDIEGLFGMVVEELKKSNACKLKTVKLNEEMGETKAEEEK